MILSKGAAMKISVFGFVCLERPFFSMLFFLCSLDSLAWNVWFELLVEMIDFEVVAKQLNPQFPQFLKTYYRLTTRLTTGLLQAYYNKLTTNLLQDISKKQ